jgi:hypothetical protein
MAYDKSQMAGSFEYHNVASCSIRGRQFIDIGLSKESKHEVLCEIFRNKMFSYRQALLAPRATHNLRLLIQYIHSYLPYLEVVSSIRNPRTRHGVMTTAQLGWSGMDGIHLAQDRNQWRALVNTVTNLQAAYNVWELE